MDHGDRSNAHGLLDRYRRRVDSFPVREEIDSRDSTVPEREREDDARPAAWSPDGSRRAVEDGQLSGLRTAAEERGDGPLTANLAWGPYRDGELVGSEDDLGVEES